MFTWTVKLAELRLLCRHDYSISIICYSLNDYFPHTALAPWTILLVNFCNLTHQALPPDLLPVLWKYCQFLLRIFRTSKQDCQNPSSGLGETGHSGCCGICAQNPFAWIFGTPLERGYVQSEKLPLQRRQKLMGWRLDCSLWKRFSLSRALG